MSLWLGGRDCEECHGARQVADLAEPGTESPMESRLRMVLVESGLPRPEVQVSIHDPFGTFVGRGLAELTARKVSGNVRI